MGWIGAYFQIQSDRIKQNRTLQNRTEQNRTDQNRIECKEIGKNNNHLHLLELIRENDSHMVITWWHFALIDDIKLFALSLDR